MAHRERTRREFLQLSATAAMVLPARRLLGQGGDAASREVVVATAAGQLRGSASGGVRVFRGVPFAEPPVGDLRFRAPVPKKAWTGVRDALRFAAASVQNGDREVMQSEDCLYLNLWVPEASGPQTPLPVFVWIHGGGFTGGESFAPLFDGGEFARTGMIVVTVAYRLGVLGFLDVEPCLGPAYAGSANNALRDLMYALEWVKRNIADFGGDPGRVTVGGESAGAKLTDLLAGVPSAEGLFHGMVSESGQAERIWPKATAENVGEGFGRQWKASASSRTLADLKTAPAIDLVKVQTAFLETWPQHFPLRCEVDGRLIPRLPIETIRAGSARGKRLLIGSNREESALFVGPDPQRPPRAADLGNVGLPVFERIYAQYPAVYPEMTEPQRLIRALTAEEYWVPTVRVADAVARTGGAVWMYELEFARSGGRYKGEAYHSEDLPLVWNKPSGEYLMADAEAALAHEMNAAWSAFLRGETPAAPGLPAWPAYNPRTRPTMCLDNVSRVQDGPQDKELRLWDGVL